MLSTILALAFEYRFIIAIVIAVIMFALLEWNKFKATAYALMLQAKSLAKDYVLKSGQEQEDWVVVELYKYLPKRISVFISEVNMHKIVHWLFVKAKDFLDDGHLNGSIK